MTKKKRKAREQSYWYALCKGFEAETYKNQAEYLRSKNSGDEITDDSSGKKGFSRAWKRYNEGKLLNTDAKRVRLSPYAQIENKIVDYFDIQGIHLSGDKNGASWLVIRKKALEFAKDLGYADFKASPGWIDNVMKRAVKQQDYAMVENVSWPEVQRSVSLLRRYCKQQGIEGHNLEILFQNMRQLHLESVDAALSSIDNPVPDSAVRHNPVHLKLRSELDEVESQGHSDRHSPVHQNLTPKNDESANERNSNIPHRDLLPKTENNIL